MSHSGEIRITDCNSRLTFIAPEPEYNSEIQEAAYWLLNSPLEFADSHTSDIFNEQEQADFERLMTKLRRIASVF